MRSVAGVLCYPHGVSFWQISQKHVGAPPVPLTQRSRYRSFCDRRSQQTLVWRHAWMYLSETHLFLPVSKRTPTKSKTWEKRVGRKKNHLETLSSVSFAPKQLNRTRSGLCFLTGQTGNLNFNWLCVVMNSVICTQKTRVCEFTSTFSGYCKSRRAQLTGAASVHHR